MSPAEVVIAAFGGVRATARALGRSPSAVSKWAKPKRERGTGGQIPTAAREIIIALAQKNGMNITDADLIHGRKVRKK